MEINFSKKNRNLVVNILGEIDHHTAEEIRTKTEKEFSRTNSKNIIFNFKNVNFMDSSGIGMVIGRYKFINSLGGKVAVIEVNSDIDRIFLISGLYKIIESYKSIEDALTSL